MYRQFELRHDDQRLTCWLEDDARLRPGTLVALKGDEERHWEITRASQMRLDAPPDRRWKVGGLL
jgi:hypothetical protein